MKRANLLDLSICSNCVIHIEEEPGDFDELSIMIIMKKMDADLGKIVSWVPVKGELANRDKGEVSMRPNLIFFFNIFFENNLFVETKY